MIKVRQYFRGAERLAKETRGVKEKV